MGAAEKAASGAVDAYLNQGILGLTCLALILLLCVAGLVIRSLYNDLKESNAVALADRVKLITAMESTRDATQGVEAALQGIRTTLETRGQAIGDLSHQVDRATQETRHSLGNLAAAMDSIARFLGRDRIGGAP